MPSERWEGCLPHLDTSLFPEEGPDNSKQQTPPFWGHIPRLPHRGFVVEVQASRTIPQPPPTSGGGWISPAPSLCWLSSGEQTWAHVFLLLSKAASHNSTQKIETGRRAASSKGVGKKSSLVHRCSVSVRRSLFRLIVRRKHVFSTYRLLTPAIVVKTRSVSTHPPPFNAGRITNLCCLSCIFLRNKQ